jgi:pimeloyl-ACP methyl ester carboxylesterase
VSTFALVHGAWHGGLCWDLLRDELGKRGHRSIAPDVPYEDPIATWDTYTEVITEALSGMDDPVVVGHSGGALMIPLVALRRPVKLLVYLCPSTPVAKPHPDSPPSLQEGAWDALKTDELGRSWWQPDDAVQGMYRRLDPAWAKRAAARLRPMRTLARTLWRHRRGSCLCTSMQPKTSFSRPSLAAGPREISSASSRSRWKAATFRCSRGPQSSPTCSSPAWN